MSYIYLENCYGVKNGRRAYLRMNGDCFDFCNDINLATNIPDSKVVDILKHADSYMAQYGANSMGIQNDCLNGKETSLKYIHEQRSCTYTSNLLMVSVHWCALNIMNHRHIFASDRMEAFLIAEYYHNIYSNKFNFPHAVYIDEEAVYEEW